MRRRVQPRAKSHAGMNLVVNIAGILVVGGLSIWAIVAAADNVSKKPIAP